MILSDENNNDIESTSLNNKKKVGVFICHCGGNIGGVVDVEAVKDKLADYPNVAVSEVDMFMCSNAGQEKISERIKDGTIDHVVVASCSPRLHQNTFRRVIKRSGLNKYRYEHVNIREQVSWAHSHEHEKATNKAISLVRAGVNKVLHSEDLETIKVPVKQRGIVIGGGITGLTAAIKLAENGLVVNLIEKSPYLGGRMAQYDNIFPTEEKAPQLLHSLIEKVITNPKITIHLNTNIEKADGFIGNFSFDISTNASSGIVTSLTDEEIQKAIEICPIEVKNEIGVEGNTKRKAFQRNFPGNFPSDVTINWDMCTKCGDCKKVVKNPESIDLNPLITTETIEAGSLVIATGFNNYEPYKGEYGWQLHNNVVTTPQLIRMLAPGGILENKFVLNKKKIENIVFIHCVGSRQVEGVNKPGGHGKINPYCSRVCCTTALELVNNIKKRFPDTNIFNLYQDIRTYGRFHEENYYEKASKNGVIFLKYLADSLPEVLVRKKDNLYVNVKDELTFGEELEIPADLVVLVTGIVPRDQNKLISDLKIPVDQDGFLVEVHPKLRPVELANAGIMISGTAQSPMDITESAVSGAAAASKAASILSKEITELEPYIAYVNPELCDGNGLCIQECEYAGAIQLVDKEENGVIMKQAMINPVLCKGCGSCVAVCPKGAIDVKGYPLKSMRDMIDAFAMEV